jgi:hypothetical protein
MEVGISLVNKEPVELRDRLRGLAASAPEKIRCRLVAEVAQFAADGALLAGLEVRATELDLNSVCKGYERELWLWLVGERTWTQCASGLEGRILRRVKALGA